MDLEGIRKELKDFPTATISRLSGVARPTIIDIRAGRTINPGINTIRAIETALKQLESERKAGGPTVDQRLTKGSSTLAKSRQVAAPQSAKKPAKTVGIPLFAQKSVWACGTLGSAVDVNSRLDMLRSFNADKCRRALAEGNIQKTVRLALERRLRRLEAGK